jgi:hypothetical protein
MGRRTIKYAFHIQSKKAIPTILFREAIGECPDGKALSIGIHDMLALLIERGAPRHAGVIREDVDLTFLGLDSIDEAVATSLGLDVEMKSGNVCKNTLLIKITYAEVSHNILAGSGADFIQLFRNLDASISSSHREGVVYTGHRQGCSPP